MHRLLGLRPRLLIALVVTAVLTLGVAALALLPPLRDRLRTESVTATESATLAAQASFDRALPSGKQRPDVNCGRVADLLASLGQQTAATVYLVDTVPVSPPQCALDDPDAGSDLLVQNALTNGIVGVVMREVRGDDLEVVLPLGRGARPEYALIVHKQLTDVAGAVTEVRDAFAKAALIGLAVAVLLGLGLSATLVRRLERLRRAALRVTREGASAPRPSDEGRDEIGDLARSFVAMQNALVRQEEARRAFVATASHELRTPLTSLQGMLELLGEDLLEGRLDLADAQEQVAAAQGELRRLGSLATELLDLSRLDAGTPLRSEPVELGELCRAIGAEMALRAEEAETPLQVVPPHGPCWARGDPGSVAQILRILLDNALRFSPGGASIRIEAGYRGERAFVAVSDRGPGVPAHERELIFQRFQRGTRTGGEGGFGLGLAIGRELAQRQGGTLSLDETTTAPGARFVCELPIELPSGGPEDEDVATPPGPPPPARRGAS